MRIGTQITLVLAILGLLITLGSGIEAYRAWDKWRVSEAAAEEAIVVQALLTASQAWAAERQSAMPVIYSRKKITGPLADQAQANQTASLAAYDALQVAIAESHLSPDDPKVLALVEAHDALAPLRERLNKVLDPEVKKKDRTLKRQWEGPFTKLIDQTADLRRDLDSELVGRVSANLDNSMALVDDIWVWGEYLSREAGRMAPLVQANKAISIKDLARFHNDLGVVETARADMARRQASLSPELQETGAEVARIYDENYTALRQELFRASAAGSKYGLSTEEWLDKANASRDLIVHYTEQLDLDLQAGIEDTIAANLTRMMIMLAVVALFLALVAFILRYARQQIINPLTGMVDSMTALAKDDLEAEIPPAKGALEVASMAAALQTFKKVRIEAVAHTKEEQKAQAAREASAQQRQALTASFQQEAESMVEQLSSSADSLQQAARIMSSTAERSSNQSSNVTQASQQANQNVQTVSAAVEQITASIQEISSQVQSQNNLAAQATSKAEVSNEQVKDLEDAADKIGDVIGLITEIAEQTNLLALNATIEAARAGEAGKGFAVVASEVKSLATQTAKATDEITSQVKEMQTKTKGTVESLGSITKDIAKMNDSASAVAQSMEQQSAAVSEVAQNIEQAAQSTSEVNQSIGEVSAAASEASGASGMVQDSADGLSSQSNQLLASVRSFAAQLKAS
ncbi:methyl-accepting chemotaxis protein [Rhodovibrionaceae bacterium A322]